MCAEAVNTAPGRIDEGRVSCAQRQFHTRAGVRHPDKVSSIGERGRIGA
jgi:hypothetical protein